MDSYKILKLLKVLSIIGVIILVIVGLLGTLRIIDTNYISLITIIVTAFVVAPIYYRKIKGIS